MKNYSKDNQTDRNLKDDRRLDFEQLEEGQPDFIREKIVKKKSAKEEIIRCFGKPAAGGLVFGLVAALIFCVCTYLFWPLLTDRQQINETEQPMEETTKQPEDAMPRNEWELEKFISKYVEEENQENITFYDSMQEALESLRNAMVMVVAAKKDVDWFEVSYDSQYTQSGLLFKAAADKYYVLTGYKLVRDVDSIQLETVDGTSISALLEGYDTVYDLAVLSIDRGKLSSAVDGSLKTAAIGNTTLLSQGTPVFVIGNPSGSEGSVGIGFVSYINEQLALTDCVIRGIQSSVQINGTGCSFLMGLDGKLLGLLTSTEQNISTGFSQAYGINHLMVYINRIINGESTAGIGITGQDIDESVREDNGIPEGIYIIDVEKDSASYQAGVQSGDVLAEVGGQKIASMSEYEGLLTGLTPGKEVKMIVYRNSKGAYKKMELNITPTVRQD